MKELLKKYQQRFREKQSFKIKIFYKVFRVYTLFNDDGSVQTRDISDNSISSDITSFGVINSDATPLFSNQH